MKLQVALDFLKREDAILILKKVAPYCDIIEAGTPLIKAEGISILEELRGIAPDKIIFADLKIADVADIEVTLAKENGADVTSVLAQGPLSTVKEGIKTGKEKGIKVVIDTIGTEDLESKIKKIEKFEPDYFLIHCGIDEQKEGKDPMENVALASRFTDIPLMVAGGIDAKKAKILKDNKNIEVIIVGGAITKAENPEKIAKEIKEIIS